MKNSELHEGKTLTRYLKGQGFVLEEVWKKLGYASRNAMNYHLAKKQLSKDFIFLVQERLKIDLSEILYPQSLTHNTKHSEPHTNMGDRELHVNNKLIKNNKYAPELDNDNSSMLTLSPVKKIRLLNEHHEINLATFQSLLPTIEDKKSWIPVFNSAEELMRLNSDNTDQKTRFPMFSDEIVRNPYVNKAMYQTVAPPFDNMSPRIFPNERIYVRQINLEDYHTAIPYLIGFSDHTAMIYYISKGSKEGYVRLSSHDKSYGEKEEPVKNIIAVYEISPRS